MVPFAAVPSNDTALDDNVLTATFGDRPFVYFVGTLPHIESRAYEFTPCNDILQMIRTRIVDPPVAGHVAYRSLGAGDVPAMIDLTSRVYPAYFRERTIEMGTYLGVFDDTALVAMAGLRMAPKGYREISGVCTDPAYAGRGYAGALCAKLAADVALAGDTPILHMDLDNSRARRLYESLGFEARADLPMCRVSRAG